MDNLPPQLILEIMRRLEDSTDVARCRVISKTFNTLAAELRSINLTCTATWYRKSLPALTRAPTTSFRKVFVNLVQSLRTVESISIRVEERLGGVMFLYDPEVYIHDSYLLDPRFVKEWLPKVCGELKELKVKDFWFQARWRRSEFLCLISSCCHNLRKLELKNAWLSADGLKPMPMLTSLTLEFVTLDDEELKMVNQRFPFLQVLNLTEVRGLTEPKIHLSRLETCRWTAFTAPRSLHICAPKLLKLEVHCIRPRSLVIETPLLSDLCLSLEKADTFGVEECPGLKLLRLESANLCSLIRSFPCGLQVKRLTVDSLKCTGPVDMKLLSLAAIFDFFPNLSALTLRSGAWSEVETSFLVGGQRSEAGMKRLSELTAQLVIYDADVTLSFLFCILNFCTNLFDVSLLIHGDVDRDVSRKLISRCITSRPKIRWRWGMWKEDMKDSWVVL